jgi:hypothetical protein
MHRFVSAFVNRAPPWMGSFSVFLILLGVVFSAAWRATHDLEWPYDFDLFRDAAFAQTIARGDFPDDAYYSGEQNWYNPLGPTVIAVVAKIFALEPIQIYAHHGAVIGLIVPLAIFVLAVALFGRWAGLAASFVFLFLGPHDVLPSWAAPTYSLWLFTNLLSLVPLALTITIALRARENSRPLTWIICGVLLGVTFLTHTATAIIAGSIVLVLAWEYGKPRLIALRWSLVLFSAVVVSLPFLVTIVGRYGLRIRNTAPLDFFWEETDLRNIFEFLRSTLNVGSAISCIGFIMLFTSRTTKAARSVMIAWLGVCLILFAYGYARQAWPGAHLPGILPSFHWLFHLRVAKALLLGFGLYCALDFITSRLDRWWKLPSPVALLLVFILFFGTQYRKISHRFDLVGARELALYYAALPGFRESVAWLRRETSADAVVLAPPQWALVLLGAAGRKTVIVDRPFSNPYVLFEPRAAAAGDMEMSLAGHQRDVFLEIALKYRVSYVLLADALPVFDDRRLTAPFARPVFAQGNFAVLRIEQ